MTDLLLERGLLAGLAPELILHHQRLCCLPHPSQMVDMMVPKDATFRISAEDAADYYHGLRHPPVRIWETAVGPPVGAWQLSPKGLQIAGGSNYQHTHALLDLCLAAPAMGDAKSPHIAQMVHQHVLLGARDPMSSDWECESSPVGHPLTPARWMTYGYPTPADVHWSGAYVDNFVLASIESSTLQRLRVWGRDFGAEHRAIVSKVRAEYSKVGIQRKQEKAEEELTSNDIWGAWLDGARRTIGISAERRVRVMQCVRLVLARR
eukprot:6489977-Amphidinium_carterae.1